MRNILLYGLLALFLAIAGNVYSSSEQGGEYLLVIHKQSGVEIPISIPDIYLQDKDKLIAPLQLKIIKGKEVILEMESLDKDIILPPLNLEKGAYTVYINLLNYSHCQFFSL